MCGATLIFFSKCEYEIFDTLSGEFFFALKKAKNGQKTDISYQNVQIWMKNAS